MSDNQSRYNILCNGEKIYSSLTQEEFFDAMEDLAQQFYETGTPSPYEIEHEVIGEQNGNKV